MDEINMTADTNEVLDQKIYALIGQPCQDLYQLLDIVLKDGGKAQFDLDTEIKLNQEEDGWSSLQYIKDGVTRAELRLAFIPNGGSVIRRSWLKGEYNIISFDLFDNEGRLLKNVADFKDEVLKFDAKTFDLNSPFIDHLYRYLDLRYQNVTTSNQTTDEIHRVEKYLRSRINDVSFSQGAFDPAFSYYFEKNLIMEADPVLKWDERQVVIASNYARMGEILKLKKRVHQTNYFSLLAVLFLRKINNFFQRTKARPLDNAKGLLYRYTIGKVLWFFSTVTDNLGYSVALAVYGPFTYYFITMPMNPHAMSAVGRVRSVYLEVKDSLSTRLNLLSVPNEAPKEVLVNNSSDQVNTKQSASTHQPIIQIPTLQTNVVGISEVTYGKKSPFKIVMDEGQIKPYQAALLNMLLSTDVSDINNQSWTERMSRFKNMQIAYEENMEFASRMGRLEQMETQYNFPMLVETTWIEMERYLNAIFKIRNDNSPISPKFKQYLVNEVNRTHQLQLYLWDRMARFILDQPYVMLDQDKEQKRNDYYIGRSFVFMNEMNQTLSWRYKDFKKPYGFEKIEKLAKAYTDNRKEFGNIVTNLKNNSDLFKQKDLLSTAEFRAYMKRQWEILYLQNAKAEEASNNGLNMYIWSVRNSVWILQSIYANKKEDLQLLLNRDMNGLSTQDELYSLSRVESLYETLFHNMTLEYVSIRQEMQKSIGKDIEASQREVVLENIKEFIVDRNKVLNKNSPTESVVENKR